MNIILINIGKSRDYKIKYIVENILNLDTSEYNLSLLSKKFSKIVFEKVIKSKYIQGSKKFLKNNAINYDFHLSTATPYKEIVSILDKKKYLIILSRINGSPETKDSHLKKILLKWKYKKNQTIFIGDSLNDYRVAKNNGIIFYGIKNEFSKFKKLKNEFTDFYQIEKYVKNTDNDKKINFFKL